MPAVLWVVAEILPSEDATRLATASVPLLRAMELASSVLESRFVGLELFGWRPFRGALFQQLRESMQAQILINEPCWKSQALVGTRPMPLALDTSGCFFVRFWVAVSGIRNGCPCVGVVDAAEVRNDPSKLFEDMSRPRQASGTFGISCNPFSGKIYASHRYNLPEHVSGAPPGPGAPRPRSWTAEVIGWESFEDALKDAKGSVEYVTWFGMLISKGTLQFIRQVPGRWESSGVVCDRLPAKVLCCAFLFSFVGQAFVSVEDVCVNGLPSCIQRHGTVCGRMSCWTAWPPWARSS